MDLKNQTQKRTIKFRIFNKKIKSYIDIHSSAIMIDELNDLNDNLIVEQFTGLYDKNGKEIYEQMELNNIFIIKWLNFRYVLFYISNLTIFEEIFDYENKLEITREYTEL